MTNLSPAISSTSRQIGDEEAEELMARMEWREEFLESSFADRWRNRLREIAGRPSESVKIAMLRRSE